METVVSELRVLSVVLLSGGLLMLAGCDTGDLTRTFGLTRDSPDEYTVTTRAPLSMPPGTICDRPSPVRLARRSRLSDSRPRKLWRRSLLLAVNRPAA